MSTCIANCETDKPLSEGIDREDPLARAAEVVQAYLQLMQVWPLSIPAPSRLHSDGFD